MTTLHETWEHDGKGNVWRKDSIADLVHQPTPGHAQTEAQVTERGAVIAAAPDTSRELLHLVRLLEPLEASGALAVPGLATLNGARAALKKAGVL